MSALVTTAPHVAAMVGGGQRVQIRTLKGRQTVLAAHYDDDRDVWVLDVGWPLLVQPGEFLWCWA